MLALARGDAVGWPGPAGHLVDDSRLLELATRHQVAALCHWQNHGRSDRPLWQQLAPETRRALRLSFLHHEMRNGVTLRDVAAIHQALTGAGIEALFCKGPWVMLQAYPTPGTRCVDDIDVCVRERDYRGAVAALATLDYTCPGGLPADGAAALHQSLFAGQLRFTARGRRMVELHFRMINVGPATDESWVWDTATTLAVGSARVRVPGPEAMLLHLLLHANQHGFHLLRLLYDVRFALARIGPTLDHDLFLRRVRQLHCGASAYHGLVLAHDLAGATVPPDLLATLRPGPLRRLVFRRLWDLDRVRRLAEPRRPVRSESPRLYVCEMGRLRDKWRYLRHIVKAAGGLRRFVGVIRGKSLAAGPAGRASRHARRAEAKPR